MSKNIFTILVKLTCCQASSRMLLLPSTWTAWYTHYVNFLFINMHQEIFIVSCNHNFQTTPNVQGITWYICLSFFLYRAHHTDKIWVWFPTLQKQLLYEKYVAFHRNKLFTLQTPFSLPKYHFFLSFRICRTKSHEKILRGAKCFPNYNWQLWSHQYLKNWTISICEKEKGSLVKNRKELLSFGRVNI